MIYIVHWADINADNELSIDCQVFSEIEDADKKVSELVYEWMQNNSCDYSLQKIGNFTGIQSTDDNRELEIHVHEHDA